MRSTLALLLLFALPALAESPLAGHWTLDRAKSDDVNAAIERTVKSMNFVVRPIARSRLRNTNPVYPSVTLAFTVTHARVTAGSSALALPLNGTPIDWKRDGETLHVTGRLHDSHSYVETFKAGDGSRTNTFTVSGDELRMAVTITSSRLPKPLQYTLVYRR